jgi:hypothetical protein
MLKKTSSFVLTSLRGSTYRKKYAFASSLVAAALEGLFEHPLRRFSPFGIFELAICSAFRNDFYSRLRKIAG